jgi:hypothetical protein
VSGDDHPQLPRAGLPVTLVLDDLRVRAKVASANESDLELSVAHAPPALRRPNGLDLRIEFVGERGPCRLMGRATIALSDAARDTRVRFDPQGHPQLLLRSERVRAPVELEIDVDAGSGPVKRRTRDLRGSGALVSGPLQLEVEAEVTYTLRIPGRTEPIQGAARVARITDDGDVALELGELPEEDYDDLLLAVFEAQRAKAA